MKSEGILHALVGIKTETNENCGYTFNLHELVGIQTETNGTAGIIFVERENRRGILTLPVEE